MDRVAAALEPLLPALSGDQDAIELVALLKRADALVRARVEAEDPAFRAVEALKENNYLLWRIEDQVPDPRRADMEAIIRELREKNQDLRRRVGEILSK